MTQIDLFVQANEAWDAGNEKRAYGLFLAAAKNGVVHAYNSVGYFLENGIGIKKNSDAALFWYKKAAKSGDVCAYTNIALIYRDLGNLERAVYWLKKAVSFNDGDAALELGKIYLGRKSEKQAADYFHLALKLKDSTQTTRDEANALLKELRRTSSDKRSSPFGKGDRFK